MDDQVPGFTEIMSHWAWDPPWLLALIVPAVWYLRAYRKLATTNPRVPFPRWKPVSLLLGLALVGFAVLSPLEHYGNQLLWVNFTGFLVLTMLAAPLILWSSPLTLAFRVSGPRGRRRLRTAARSRFVTAVTFPPVTWFAFAVATFAWQFAAPTEWAARNVFVRDFQQASLLFVALLFWYPALYPDPIRWRLAYPVKALYLVVEMAHKALFGAFFLSTSTPIHPYFAENAPAWAPSPMTDQTMAIVILWLAGNGIFVAIAAGLSVLWIRHEALDAARTDRRIARQREEERRRKEALQQVFQR